MSINNSYQHVLVDKSLQNLLVTNSLKIPIFPTLVAAGDVPSFLGNVIFNEADSSFYGHDGVTWQPFQTGVSDCECVFDAAVNTVEIRPRAALIPANIGISLHPRGTGALTGDHPDNLVSGGNVRGTYAVDWQLIRTQATDVAGAENSTISGGFGNAVDPLATAATVSGGQNNQATLNSTFAVLGGGSNLTVADSSHGSILSGGTQILSQSDYAGIGTGQSNVIVESPHSGIFCGGGVYSGAGGNFGEGSVINRSANALIGGGRNNEVLDSDFGTICGGGGVRTVDPPAATDQNKIEGSPYSFIGAGQNNLVASVVGFDPGHSVICGGQDNVAGNTGASTNSHNAILGGSRNNIAPTDGDAGTYCSMLGGDNNGIVGVFCMTGAVNNCTIGSSAEVLQGCMIGAGANHSILVSNFSAVLSGENNDIASETAADGYSVICGGQTNRCGNTGVFPNSYNFIGGGSRNSIGLGDGEIGQNCGIVCGDLNTIFGVNCCIVGGTNHDIGGVGGTNNGSVIGGGDNHQIDVNCNQSGVFSGANNTISNNATNAGILGGSLGLVSGSFSVVGGGENNRVIASTHAAVLSGQNGTVQTGANFACVVNGQDNEILSTGLHSAIIGCNNQTLEQSETTLVRRFRSRGGHQLQTTTVSNVILNLEQHVVRANTAGGVVAVGLPAAPVLGQQYIIKRVGANALSVAGNGNNIIDNVGASVASIVGIADGQTVEVVWDGSDWLQLR